MRTTRLASPLHVQFPAPYRRLAAVLCRLSLHVNGGVAERARLTVEAATKRFPVLSPTYAAVFLAAIADVPYSLPEPPAAPPPAFFAALRAAAATAEPAPGGAASGGESEAERNGRVVGAAQALSCNLNFWRLFNRRPLWMSASLYGFLAARVHNASVPQKALGELVITYAGRALHPLSLSYDSEEYGALVRLVLELARPGGMGRNTPFRYTQVRGRFTVPLRAWWVCVAVLLNSLHAGETFAA